MNVDVVDDDDAVVSVMPVYMNEKHVEHLVLCSFDMTPQQRGVPLAQSSHTQWKREQKL